MFNERQFGIALYTTRHERGKSLRDVAAETGTTASTLSRIEHGSVPEIETFATLCSWMSVDPSQFFSGIGVGAAADVLPFTDVS